MKFHLLLLMTAVLGITSTALHAQTEQPIAKAKMGAVLAAQYKTPDGMTLAKDGSIILAVPASLEAGPAYLLRITKEDKVEPYFTLAAHPQTGHCCSLGIAFGPDGHLYVADGQGIGGNTTHKSRLLRVIHENGQPIRTEVLVTGLVQANGLEVFGNRVYVNETQFDAEINKHPFKSGVFSFDITEFDHLKEPIHVSANGADPHCIFTLETNNPDWPVGANGLGFSADGKMYVANFGDKSLIEVILKKDGKTVESSRICVAGGLIQSVDGLKVDQKTGYVYFADFAGNAVFVVNPQNGKVVLLAQDPLGTDKTGDLDRCSEVALRDGFVYAANIDLPFGQKNGPVPCISKIDTRNLPLDKLLKD